MKKNYFQAVSFCLLCLSLTFRISAQCTFLSQYGNATINNTIPGNVVVITTCQWGGEYAPVTFNVTGAFTFSSSVATDYLTLTNSNNVVVASGLTPLSVGIATTGIYNLHTAASGPPLCLTQNVCRTTQVNVPIPPCTGTPVTGTTSGSQALICPNTSATLTLPGASTGTGLMYQWYSSTVNIAGPYTAIPGATGLNYITSPSASLTTWYQSVITCTNSASNATSAPISVGIAGTTTNSIPYSEGFEGTIVNNQLPNCSWKASNMPITCQTYVSSNINNRVPRTGSKFASFYYLPASNSYFYTNGLKFEAGVTYSASVWYTSEYFGYTNWTDLSIMLGPNQTTLGLNTIASTNGPAASSNYKSLSGTFTVATSGIYYVAIKANSNGACCAQYLSFDDLAITAPCNLNIPNVTFNISSDTICAGQSVNMSVIGATNYLWSTGATTSSIVAYPSTSTTYSVMSTSSLSGCSTVNSAPVEVFPLTPIGIVSSSIDICLGQSALITAFGAITYSWSTGANGPFANVSPLTTTSYSVIGTNAFGCNNQSAITITVNPLPNISALSSKTLVCSGESISLTAQGGVTYQWVSGNNLYFGNPLLIIPQSTAVYSVTGTNNKGCSNTYILVQNVTACSGINTNSFGTNKDLLFPNPNMGVFNLRFNNNLENTIEIADAYGKILFVEKFTGTEHRIDISEFSKGLYIVKISSSGNTETIKMVKE